MGTVNEEFLIKDIKGRIRDSYRSVDYIEGFMFACYLLRGISKKVLDELKVYLEEKYKKEEEK